MWPDPRFEITAIGRFILAFDVVFRGFNAVKNGVLRVPMREMRLANRQNVIFLITELSGLAVMARRPLMVVSRRGVMFGAT